MASTTAGTPTDPSTWTLNHTMLRIKDPAISLPFYTSILGMTQIHKIPQPAAKFDLYFLAYTSPSKDSESSIPHWTSRSGVLELTHNHGTEKDDSYKSNNGNEDPHKGFGHIAISVPDVHAACARLEGKGVGFVKKLSEGKMREIAFARDPDGYWVEIIPQGPVKEAADAGTAEAAAEAESEANTEKATEGYKLNHSMLRIKDPEISKAFYIDILGMTLLYTKEVPAMNFNLYFLGYGPPLTSSETDSGAVVPIAHRTGLLELTWNYGTEKQSGKIYHDGNSEPQGFGNIGVSVDDLEAACGYLEGKGVEWKKRLTEGRMKSVAFVKDPDGYWIEVIQNEERKRSKEGDEIR